MILYMVLIVLESIPVLVCSCRLGFSLCSCLPVVGLSMSLALD